MFCWTDVCYGLLFAPDQMQECLFSYEIVLKNVPFKVLLMGKEIYQPYLIGVLTIR